MPLDPNRTDWIARDESDEGVAVSEHVVVAAVAAATAYEAAIFKAPSGGSACTINKISFFANAAIVGAATNFQTLQVRQFRAGVLVGLLTGALTFVTTASLATLTEFVLLPVASAVAIRPSDVLTLQNATTGAGAALPSLTTCVEYNVSP